MAAVLCCLVPGDTAGLVIGRGGSMIRQISQTSGAEVSITTEEDTPPTLSDRIVTIWGDDDQKERACAEVVKITHRAQDVQPGEEGIFVIVVPTSAASFIIGPRGATITGLMEESGAEISVSRHAVAGTELQPVSVAGDLKQTLAAIRGIGALLQELKDWGRLTGDLWERPAPSSQRGASGSRSITPSGAGGKSAASGGAASRSVTPSKSAVSPPRSITPPVSRAAAPPARSITPPATRRTGQAPPTPTRRPPEAPRASSPAQRSQERRRVQPIQVPSAAERADGSIGAVIFAVDPPVAAWIIGKNGRSVSELRAASGAEIDVSRGGSSYRLVEIRGRQKARTEAVDRLLALVNELPSGAPSETRLVVPEAAVSAGLYNSDQSSSMEELRSSCPEVDIELFELDAAGADGQGSFVGGCLLVLRGRSAEEAAAHAAARLGEASEAAPATPLRVRGARAALQAAALDRPSNPQSISGEEQLIRQLLSGSGPAGAKVKLFLPSTFVRHVLLDDKQLSAIAARSGSHLQLEGKATQDAVHSLTLTGSMLGNSMAVLYIQEKLLEHLKGAAIAH